MIATASEATADGSLRCILEMIQRAFPMSFTQTHRLDKA